MKIKSLFIAGCLVIASSCSDFLDHPITDAVSDDNIGEIVADNPAMLGEFLANAYRSTGHIDLYGRQLQNSITAMAHEIDLDYIADESRNQFAKNDINSANTFLKLYYQRYYSILASVNLTLDLIEHMDMSALDEENRTMVLNFRGEALFLRAFTHFDLLRLFGERGPYFNGDYPNNKDAQGIVLAMKVVDAEDAFLARATVEECYLAIIDDLKEAEKCIGNNQIPVNTTVPYPGYKDLDYIKNFGWAQKPAVNALMGKVYLYMSEFQNAKTEFEKVIGDNRFKLDRPVNLTDYIQHIDNNAECIFTLQYFDSPGDTYTGAPQHHINRIYGNVPGAWANYFLDQRTAARFGDDPRLYETTLYDYTWAEWSTATTAPTWKKLDINVPDYRYYPRKAIDFFNTSSPRDCSKNVDIIRLADVYLMYAETILNLGSTSEATEYVNKVRRRAWNESDYHAPGTKGEDLSTVNISVIQEERFKELFFENTRWFDLCRWGILESELAKYPTTKAGAVHYDPNDYYIPIPESELKSNPLLKQSKGY